MDNKNYILSANLDNVSSIEFYYAQQYDKWEFSEWEYKSFDWKHFRFNKEVCRHWKTNTGWNSEAWLLSVMEHCYVIHDGDRHEFWEKPHIILRYNNGRFDNVYFNTDEEALKVLSMMWSKNQNIVKIKQNKK